MKSSADYSRTIRKYFKYKKLISTIVCFMGEDGHVASIFPNSVNLYKEFITKPIIRKDFKRITLGLKM